MMKFQKVIKYLAIGFAVLLVINIFSIIFGVIISMGNLFDIGNNVNGDKSNDYGNVDMDNYYVNSEILILDVDVKYVNVTFKEGNDFRIDTNSEYVKINERQNKLVVNERKANFLNNGNRGDLVIQIPREHKFLDVELESGAGKIEIDGLNVNNLDLSLGAGSVNIDNLQVFNETSIEAGAGKVLIDNAYMNNLDLDMGVGEVTLNTELNGINEIDAGVGKLNIGLIGNDTNYKVKLNKGLGEATLNGEKMENNKYYGNGSNLIDIDGGIGSININYIR